MNLPRSIAHVILAALVAGVYMYAYVYFLNPFFEYAGFMLYQRDAGFLALSVVISIAPIVLYTEVRALSSMIAAIVYAMLYVPIILTFALGAPQSPGEILLIQLTFMAGMCLLFLADRVALVNPWNLDVATNLQSWVLVLTAVFTVYVLIVYRGSLRFVSFGQAVYEQRFATAALGADVFTRYVSSWLSNVLVPLCLAYGLAGRKRWYFVAGTTACIVLYMATAAKIMVLLPPVYVAFYLVFSGGRLRTFFPLLTVGLSVFMAAMTAIAAATVSGIGFVVASILLNRTIGSGGQVTVAYYDFFSFFPQTNYTHINLVQAMTQASPYPGRGLGEVVGQYVYDPLMNANANFWATDGLAALGLVGVIVASVGLALVMLVMNAMTRDADRLYAMLCFLPFTTQILNTSLFSSLWSGGGFFLLVFFLVAGKNALGASAAERPRNLELTPSTG